MKSIKSCDNIAIGDEPAAYRRRKAQISCGNTLSDYPLWRLIDQFEQLLIDRGMIQYAGSALAPEFNVVLPEVFGYAGLHVDVLSEQLLGQQPDWAGLPVQVRQHRYQLVQNGLR
jgi:hypothetical protein